MELKPRKAKKKTADIVSWKKMLRTPVLLLLLLGSINCDSENETEISKDINNSSAEVKFRHNGSGKRLCDIKYLRRHLNRKIVNFVMTDVLVDGEVENRIHFNGVTAKETSVDANGSGLKLRQLTDGRHLVQVIYTPNGVIQDCEYITEGKSARDFLKTLRKELKLALDEESYRIQEKIRNVEDEKFIRHFGNVTFRLLRDGEKLPPHVASWFNYDRLKAECFERHEELTYMLENKNKVGETSLTRFRACLKLADTSVSNMVGKLFFNIVQTRCFVLKPVRTCTQRSWWGKCLRIERVKQAFLRNNLPY